MRVELLRRHIPQSHDALIEAGRGFHQLCRSQRRQRSGLWAGGGVRSVETDDELDSGSSHFCSNTALIISHREDLVFLLCCQMDGCSSSGVPVRRRSGPSEIVSFRSHQRRAAVVPQVTPQSEASRRGPSPEEVMSVARARVTKLAAAVAIVGETDPIFTHLQEALKAKAQCQVRRVEDRIAFPKEFIERAKKRIACQAEVSQVQEVLAKGAVEVAAGGARLDGRRGMIGDPHQV